MSRTVPEILDDHANRHDGGKRIVWSDLTDQEKANLSGANLSGANLFGANLSGADLRGANLRGANLFGANLRGANLFEADLCGANLFEADLFGANLFEADLRGANLRGANLRGANLFGANLFEANLFEADLSLADLSGAKGLPQAPVVEDLDAKILAIAEQGDPETFNMCETALCRAGNAIMLAGDEGQKLLDQFGWNVAGALIYKNSTGQIPNFYCSNEEAIDDMKKRVGR